MYFRILYTFNGENIFEEYLYISIHHFKFIFFKNDLIKYSHPKIYLLSNIICNR